ncbi:hypothetical protein NSK_003518 [Nannochloropsis salina CCMP1776]|uniref:glutathione-specific gamma-glutamylcyclotransferase n=1 Tax=Nannochloropsis salina CCMP1776 TaxID=1027361 RepID=A0A4D9D275_9STRA|nr:hypothetical protein NSK_003518 [Nannochloropsis salina CCMP1776]|eukprot:TFJ85094.1 hypothetical protein NSK_003518 [Nannochloropsis salina CCMP1776]
MISMLSEVSSSTTGTERKWDAVQGVWVGSRALADEANDVPSPLYIFGYGSLMFRPQESFASCERVDGVVKGWKRVWAQRSCDHRGEPHMPGLVVTVLSDSELETMGMREATDPPSRVHGVAYRIPDENVARVLDELDFREKGGYTRAVVEVKPTTSSTGGTDKSGRQEVIRALLYTANADNPNFHHPSTLEEAAHIVAWSRGPSGENREYLFEIEAYLRRAGAECPETFALTTRVEEVLERGLDRRGSLDARFRRDLVVVSGTQGRGGAEGIWAVWQRLRLHAWGSNQHGQLGKRVEAVSNGASDLDMGVNTDKDDDWPLPQPTVVEVDVATTVSLQSGSRAQAADEHRLLVRQLAAGGGHSAIVTSEDRLYLWGWNEAGQVGGSKYATLDGTHRVHVFPRRVAMVALGHAHTLVLEKDTGKLYGVGGNAAGEATGVVMEQRKQCRAVGGGLVTLDGGSDPIQFSWCDAGVRHSAGVTRDDGRLVTWGVGRSGACLPSSVRSWAPVDGAKVRKVWCGWQHTVVLDDRGRVWTLGANQYGQLGRRGSQNEGLPELVEWPEGAGREGEGVRVEEVACGWSHVLVKTHDGEVWGWGRNTFGQLGLEAGAETETIGRDYLPRPLLKDRDRLPHGVQVDKVTCGSESSMLVGKDGSLWVCGWNEHGNLGVGDGKDRKSWTLVPGLSAGSEGGKMLVACGGAHTLAMSREPSDTSVR